MESETPPPPPTPSELRSETLSPSSVLPDSDYAHFRELSANSGSVWNAAIRRLSLHMQYGGAQVTMRLLNDLRVYDGQKLVRALGRPANQSLLTLANHQSTMDDPALLAALTPYAVMTSPTRARWGWCARELCFPSRFTGWFFLHGKIFPVIRGLGLYQKAMREAEEHLVDGDWMHVFPEGKCIPIPTGVGQLRWGTGKLIADAYRRSRSCEALRDAFKASTAATSSAPAPPASTLAARSPTASSSSPASSPRAASASFHAPCPLPPVVLPLIHHGMPKVMPFYHTVPKRGKTVRAIWGDPIEFGDLIDTHERNAHNRAAFDWPAEEDLYVAITQRCFERMQSLDQQLIGIAEQEATQS